MKHPVSLQYLTLLAKLVFAPFSSTIRSFHKIPKNISLSRMLKRHLCIGSSWVLTVHSNQYADEQTFEWDCYIHQIVSHCTGTISRRFIYNI